MPKGNNSNGNSDNNINNEKIPFNEADALDLDEFEKEDELNRAIIYEEGELVFDDDEDNIIDNTKKASKETITNETNTIETTETYNPFYFSDRYERSDYETDNISLNADEKPKIVIDEAYLKDEFYKLLDQYGLFSIKSPRTPSYYIDDDDLEFNKDDDPVANDSAKKDDDFVIEDDNRKSLYIGGKLIEDTDELIFSQNVSIYDTTNRGYCSADHYSLSDIFNSKEPTAIQFSNGKGTVILSKNENGFIIDNNPEKFYNYSLNNDFKKLDDLYTNAYSRLSNFNSMIGISKSPFNTIKEKLEVLRGLGELKSNSDNERYKAVLNDLKEACNKYSIYKNEDINQKIAKNPSYNSSELEQSRIIFANEVMTFVNKKINALDTIDKAYITLSTKDLSANEEAVMDKDFSYSKKFSDSLVIPLLKAVEFDMDNKISQASLDISKIKEKYLDDFKFDEMNAKHKMQALIPDSLKETAKKIIVPFAMYAPLLQEYNKKQSDPKYEYQLFRASVKMQGPDYREVVANSKPVQELLENLDYQTLYNFVTDENVRKDFAFKLERNGDLSKSVIDYQVEKIQKRNKNLVNSNNVHKKNQKNKTAQKNKTRQKNKKAGKGLS